MTYLYSYRSATRGYVLMLTYHKAIPAQGRDFDAGDWWWYSIRCPCRGLHVYGGTWQHL